MPVQPEMFHQLLTPVGGSLFLSFLVATIPIIVVLVMLGVLRRPAWQASLAGLATALVIAIGVWQMPVGLAVSSTGAGVAFALWPIMWIVFAALILYNTAVLSGRFDAFRRWVLDHLPNDKRIVLIVIGYGFGSLLEGVSGFGAPVAITASLLIMLGFKAIDAVVYALIFNTAPVAFGSLGIPITTLAGVTDLPAHTLGADQRFDQQRVRRTGEIQSDHLLARRGCVWAPSAIRSASARVRKVRVPLVVVAG